MGNGIPTSRLHSDVHGVEIRGLSLVDAPPLGHLHLPLRPGVTAIYGPNGVGKTRLLTSLESLLSQMLRSDAFEDTDATPRVSSIKAAYQRGGLHIWAPVTQDRLAKRSRWLPPFAELALYQAESEAQHAAFDSRGQVATPTQIAADAWENMIYHVQHVLPWADASSDDASYLLVNGCWFLDRFDHVRIADPDPYRGPLAPRWDASDRQWMGLLKENARSPDGEARLGSLLGWWPPGSNGEWHLPFAFAHPRSPWPILPPRPEVLGLTRWPDWAALPVALCPDPSGMYDETIDPPIVESDLDPNALTASRVAEMAARLGRWTDPTARLDRFSRTANEIIRYLFADDLELTIESADERDWFEGKLPLRWTVRHRSVRGLSIDQLGTAHSRYCSLAVQSATAATRVERTFDPIFGGVTQDEEPLPTVAIIDEPERALHPVAEKHLAAGLSALANYVVVSTHGPEVLAFADHRLTLALGDDSFSLLETPGGALTPGTVRVEADRLGMTPADILRTATAIVLVEGPHDVEVVRSYLEPEMEDQFIMLVPLYGTDGLNSIASATYLFESSSAPIVVCLDNLRNEVRSDLETVKRITSPTIQRKKLSELRHESRYRRSREMATILSLARTAVDDDRLDRIHVHPFSKPDIARYIDADLVSGRDLPWDVLEREFLATRTPPQTYFTTGDGDRFKKWIGDGYTTNGLVDAVERQLDRWRQDLGVRAHRHQDFTDLAELLARLRSRTDAKR